MKEKPQTKYKKSKDKERKWNPKKMMFRILFISYFCLSLYKLSMDFSFMSYPFSFILWFSFCYPLFNLLENHFCFLFRLSVKFLSSLNLILNTIGEVHNDNEKELAQEKRKRTER